MIVDRTKEWYEKAAIHLCNRLNLNYIHWIEDKEISIFFPGFDFIDDHVKTYSHKEWVGHMWPLYREYGEDGI